jgi:anti-sigma B factor antagonist
VRESSQSQFPAPQIINEGKPMPEAAAVSLLTLEVERVGEVATVKCHGKLVMGVCDVLASKVKTLIPDTKRIVLDLTDLQHMDSMGLGTIVRLYASAKSGGSCLVLVNLGPRIRQLLGITNLLSVLTDMCEQGVTIRF